MKIIENKTTKAKEVTSKEITCPSCNSILEYNDTDLTHDFWRTEGWTNSSIKYRGFICPCCKYEIGIQTLIGS